MRTLFFTFSLPLLLAGICCLPLQAQETKAPANWQVGATVGSYATSIFVPKFSPFHPHLRVYAQRQWNKNPRSQWIQQTSLAYYRHAYVQHGVQLFTELGWQREWDNGLRILPLSIGGGYVLSISDTPTLRFDESTGRYEEVGLPARNNFMISLSSRIGYRTPWKVAGRPLAISLTYGLHVQGPFINQTAAIVAYSPLLLGIELPLRQL